MKLQTNRTFKYLGINKNGQEVKGVISALDVESAKKDLIIKEIDIIKINKLHKINFSYSSKIKNSEIIFFTKQLSGLIEAQISLIESLEIIKKSCMNLVFKNILNNIKNDISSGYSLSSSLKKYPKYFNNLYISLILSGEKTGNLNTILKELTLYQEITENSKQKFKRALTYPIILILSAISIIIIILSYIVPILEGMFVKFNNDIPLATQNIINVSNFFKDNIYYLVLSLILFFIVLKILKKIFSPYIKIRDTFILKIPFLGNILKQIIFARFLRALSITFNSGINIVDSITINSKVMNNYVYEKAILKIRNNIINGSSISYAFSETNLFSDLIIQMIDIGENSAKLNIMLIKTADIYENEVVNKLHHFNNIIEPLIILFVGIIIAIIIISLYLPIFQISNNI